MCKHTSDPSELHQGGSVINIEWMLREMVHTGVYGAAKQQ